MFAFLCNEDGVTGMGSDSVIRVDGRKSTPNQVEEVRQYRQTFFKNFRHKFDSWTHVFFWKDIRSAPQKPQPNQLHKL